MLETVIIVFAVIGMIVTVIMIVTGLLFMGSSREIKRVARGHK
jgi:hypothetical protein